MALLEPVFAAAGEPFFLVGHSYGAAVALMAALARPERIRAIALYEPTLFALLDEEAPGQEAANGIRFAAADAAAAIDAGDHAAAAQRFIDYWMGPGSWSSMPEPRQAPIAASMVNVAGWARALFSEPTPLRAFRALDLPVLYMVGGQSPASARGVARLIDRLAGQGHGHGVRRARAHGAGHASGAGQRGGGGVSRPATDEAARAFQLPRARNRNRSPTGDIVSASRSCTSLPSAVDTSAISKASSSIAATIFISDSAR